MYCVDIDRQCRFCLIVSVLVTASAVSAQQPSPSEPTGIQQILKVNCQPCHNEANKSSGLALTSRDAILAGGNRGAAVKPGSPAESLLVRAIEQSGELKMPPGRKLQPNEIASIRSWIEQGMAWPKDAVTSSRPKGADWWAFQPVKRVAPPATEDAAWVRNPIDAFILARLEKEHLKPSPAAAKETLLRRVSLDLTGLRPVAARDPRLPCRYERPMPTSGW